MPDQPSPRKVCFALHVRPELLDEYRDRHSPVWPQMLHELRRAGRSNYSLFLHPNGLLVGYYETDRESDTECLAGSPIVQAWESEMSAFFSSDQSQPDHGAEELDLVFDLDAQLAAID